MKWLRITNPSAMDLDEMRTLLEEAAEVVPESPSVDDMLDWLRKNVDDPKIALIVATEGGLRFQGVALVSLHTDIWAPDPWVVSVYSRKPDGRRALAIGMRDTLREAGHERCKAINQTGVSDRGYAFLWRKLATVKVLGPAVQFDLT